METGDFLIPKANWSYNSSAFTIAEGSPFMERYEAYEVAADNNEGCVMMMNFLPESKLSKSEN